MTSWRKLLYYGSDWVMDAPSLSQLIQHPGLLTLIEEVRAYLGTNHVGFFLHGSWASESNRSDSDIDLLALTEREFDLSQRSATKSIAQAIAKRHQLPLDFHIHCADGLAEDPYVDLWSGAIHIAGFDPRPNMPEPDLDSRARESVAITCQAITSVRAKPCSFPLAHPDPDERLCGRFRGTTPRALGKSLGWMASAYCAASYGYAPTGERDAIHTLERNNDVYAKWLVGAMRCLRASVDKETEELTSVCDECLGFENATLEAISGALEAGVLGAKCDSVLRSYMEST